FTIKGKSVLADPDTQVTNYLSGTAGTQPTNLGLVGFKITPTGEHLSWTDLTISLSYGGTMADADITNAKIYVDTGTVGTYDAGTDALVGAQSVNASGGVLIWDAVAGTVTAATDYLIVFDAGAVLSNNETVQAIVTAADITVAGVDSSLSITTSGDVDNEPLHTVTAAVLTGVSNSPAPDTVSDTSTHTVSFTTAGILPADGKIVVTFDPGFDLSEVGDTDISSGTMDGTFTVGISGQELTITRSGGGTNQAPAAVDIVIADITNTS
ncbi:unnamed protein product, partial [marine sediment metagenome]